MSRSKHMHDLAVCAFVESGMTDRLAEKELENMDNVDLICVQLYMDRLGHGLNGPAVAARRRR